MEEPRTRGAFHPPKQGRSQRTLNRIAEAALELMEEHGVEGEHGVDVPAFPASDPASPGKVCAGTAAQPPSL